MIKGTIQPKIRKTVSGGGRARPPRPRVVDPQRAWNMEAYLSGADRVQRVRRLVILYLNEAQWLWEISQQAAAENLES